MHSDPGTESVFDGAMYHDKKKLGLVMVFGGWWLLVVVASAQAGMQREAASVV